MIKKFLFHSENYSSSALNLGLLIHRLGFGLIMMFAHGLGKIPPNKGFVGFLGKLGLPAPEMMAWGAGLSEMIAALFVAVGLATRLSSLTLVITMSVAAFLAHGGDPFAKQEKAILYLVSFLVIFIAGPGKYSVDGLIKK